MKIINDEGFCTCCGTYGELKYGQENFSIIKKDLANYKKYKDVFVYECKNCGFISVNIGGEEGVLYGDVKDTYEYKQIYNYAYLNGLDTELYDNHSQEVPANLYEAYSLIALKQKNYELYIRIINKVIELKEIMARKYRRSQDELGGEEENDDEYDKLDNLIKLSIESNRKQIDYYFDFIENKSLYTKLLYIENMYAMGEKAKAKVLYEKLDKKIIFEEDLEQYFEQLLNK